MNSNNTNAKAVADLLCSEHDPAVSFTYKTTKKLIQMVQGSPCLWDRQAIDYKDRLARDRAWAQIFEELNPQYKEGNATTRQDIGIAITKKWYNIRDSYVKSLKPDYLGRRVRPYIHAELLQFLDDCYLEKINTSYLEKVSKQQQEIEEYVVEDQDNGEESEPWEQKVFVNLDEEEPSNKRPKIDLDVSPNTKTNEEDIISVLSNLIQKEEDEDRAFFKSITPSVKRLSEDSKIEFRIEVLKLIKKLRAKDYKGTKESNDESDSD